MKILAIGLYGIPSSHNSNLVAANVFEDYDVVIVNPDGIDTLYTHNTSHYYNWENRILTNEFASFANNINRKRRKQVRGLMQKNGVLICFLQPFMNWRDAASKQIITNYDWLFDYDEIREHFNQIIYGTGTTIDYINSSHPFAEYLLTRPPWNAYIEKSECDEREWKTLASAFGTHLLSISRDTEGGHIIFLPSNYESSNGELLEQCIRKLLGEKEVTPIPDWAKSITVPGQNQILKDLEEIDANIDVITEKRNSLITNNQTLESWKWLLYETGKYRLEPIVQKALSLLGCKVEPQPDSDSDGKVETEFGIALLEIEGAKETVKIDKISQLLRNIANFVAQEKIPVKGILVGNPFRGEELSNRPPKGSQKKLFSNEVISNAEMQNISVLLSTDLYEIICLILDNKLSATEIESLRNRIFQEKGLVRLSIC